MSDTRHAHWKYKCIRNKLNRFCSVAYILNKVGRCYRYNLYNLLNWSEQAVLKHHSLNLRMRENGVTYYINIHWAVEWTGNAERIPHRRQHLKWSNKHCKLCFFCAILHLVCLQNTVPDFLFSSFLHFFSPGHRAVYVGVHVPLGRESKRRHRHRGHKHHRKKKERDSDEGKEDGRESPSYGWTIFLHFLHPAYTNTSSLYQPPAPFFLSSLFLPSVMFYPAVPCI